MIACLLTGHHWFTLAVDLSHAIALAHCHPQAGEWNICTRCGKERNWSGHTLLPWEERALTDTGRKALEQP